MLKLSCWPKQWFSAVFRIMDFPFFNLYYLTQKRDFLLHGNIIPQELCTSSKNQTLKSTWFWLMINLLVHSRAWIIKFFLLLFSLYLQNKLCVNMFTLVLVGSWKYSSAPKSKHIFIHWNISRIMTPKFHANRPTESLESDWLVHSLFTCGPNVCSLKIHTNVFIKFRNILMRNNELREI